jgi:hypothetical protein
MTRATGLHVAQECAVHFHELEDKLPLLSQILLHACYVSRKVAVVGTRGAAFFGGRRGRRGDRRDQRKPQNEDE